MWGMILWQLPTTNKFHKTSKRFAIKLLKFGKKINLECKSFIQLNKNWDQLYQIAIIVYCSWDTLAFLNHASVDP